MANHPYNQHREQQVAHRRVATILSGSPAGASQHAQGHAYSKITSKSAASRDDEVSGYARGGKVKGNTTVNIVIPGAGAGGPKPPMPMPPMGGPPPPMPMPAPPMGGLPPGGPPGMPPMRASGGRVGKFSGGAATGVGREEKAAKKKRK